MKIASKTKSHAKRLRTNNKRVCIDCLKLRSNKNKFDCKKCGCTEFYVFDDQIFSPVILSTLYNG